MSSRILASLRRGGYLIRLAGAVGAIFLRQWVRRLWGGRPAAPDR